MSSKNTNKLYQKEMRLKMKKLTIIIVVALLITCNGCSLGTDNKPNFDVVGSNVTIWEDSTGEYSIILAFEVSNLINKSLYFKESDFDIVDENGNLVETMKLVSAYPSVVEPKKTAVYYDAKISDKISDTSIKLKAIPHIEAEKSKVKKANLHITGATTGGSSCASGIVVNGSSMTEYNNVHIAIISRKTNNEVVSVMTATIDSIKPDEQINFEVRDRLKERELGPNVVTKYQNFAYIDPLPVP